MLHDKLKKLMEKKAKDGSGPLSDIEKSAKSSVLDDLKDQAENAMSGKLHGLAKATVYSNSPEGLSEGLSKAKNILSHSQEANMKHEAESHPDHSTDKLMGEAEEGHADEHSPEEMENSDHEAKKGYEDDSDESPREDSDDERAAQASEEHTEGSQDEEDPSEYEGMSEEHVNAKLKKLMDHKKKHGYK